MIRPGMRDASFLKQKSESATEADKQTAQIILHECNHLKGVII